MKNSVKHKHHFWCPGNCVRWVKKGKFFPLLCGRGHGLTPYNISEFSSVQSLSCVWFFANPWMQHVRPPCPSPTPRVYPNSYPLSWWCHPTISSSVIPSPPALNFPQHQGLFKWVSSSHQVAKVLEFQLQHQCFQWTPRTDRSPLGWTGWISLQSKGL